MVKFVDLAAESETVEENTHALCILLCAEDTGAHCDVCFLLRHHPTHSFGARS